MYRSKLVALALAAGALSIVPVAQLPLAPTASAGKCGIDMSCPPPSGCGHDQSCLPSDGPLDTRKKKMSSGTGP